MAKQPKYEELVVRAEKAVAAVKDPELRRVAFEKVLDDLLAAFSSPAPAAASKGRSRKAAAKTPARKTPSGPSGYLREILDEGFFRSQKTIAQVKAELENRGHHIPLTSLSGPLQALCQRRVLRRQKKKTRGNKQTYSYSEW